MFWKSKVPLILARREKRKDEQWKGAVPPGLS
jgi:hypothetical protein